MTQLNELENNKLELGAMLVDLDDAISTSKEQLSASFTDGTNSDKLSQKVAQLEAKHSGLLNAVDRNAKCINEEQQRLIDEDKQTDLDQRKLHVLNALKSLDRASKLQGELLQELQDVVVHNDKALFRNHSEIQKAVRGIVGKLALEFNLHGSLTMGAVLPVPTSADYERLVTHIN